MMLLGEGAAKNVDEGLVWLERAGAQGHHSALGLLVDCYASGVCEAPMDPAKAQLWRSRLEEYERRNRSRAVAMRSKVPFPNRHWSACGTFDGVVGFGFMSTGNQFYVSYESGEITAAELDEKIRAGLGANLQV